jgi:hypothetical protein
MDSSFKLNYVHALFFAGSFTTFVSLFHALEQPAFQVTIAQDPLPV